MSAGDTENGVIAIRDQDEFDWISFAGGPSSRKYIVDTTCKPLHHEIACIC